MFQCSNRWYRRWFFVIMLWAVPVVLVGINEIRIEMAYNNIELERALNRWTLTMPQRAMHAAAGCHGALTDAQAAGCPTDVLAANAKLRQEARDEFALRRATLAHYLLHAFIGYWVMPAAFLLFLGLLIGGIRRALRRPPIVRRGTPQ